MLPVAAQEEEVVFCAAAKEDTLPIATQKEEVAFEDALLMAAVGSNCERDGGRRGGEEGRGVRGYLN